MSFIEPHYVDYPPNSFCDEPPSDIRNSQPFIRDLVETVVASPNWDKTLLLITYDEHGGFYDHVPPPHAVPVAPGMLQTTGVRVPSFLVSPWIKAGSVFGSDNVHFDHTSILKTISRRFLTRNYPFLGARYAAAHDLSEVLEHKIHSPRFRPFIPYTLVCDASKMCLDVRGGSKSIGGLVWQYTPERNRRTEIPVRRRRRRVLLSPDAGRSLLDRQPHNPRLRRHGQRSCAGRGDTGPQIQSRVSDRHAQPGSAAVAIHLVRRSRAPPERLHNLLRGIPRKGAATRRWEHRLRNGRSARPPLASSADRDTQPMVCVITTAPVDRPNRDQRIARTKAQNQVSRYPPLTKPRRATTQPRRPNPDRSPTGRLVCSPFVEDRLACFEELFLEVGQVLWCGEDPFGGWQDRVDRELLAPGLGLVDQRLVVAARDLRACGCFGEEAAEVVGCADAGAHVGDGAVGFAAEAGEDRLDDRGVIEDRLRDLLLADPG